MRKYTNILALALSIGLAVLIFVFRGKVMALGAYGYLGIFLISVATSATLALPLPGLAIVMASGAVLNPFLVGVCSAAGGTIGEMNGYLLGYGGQVALTRTKQYERMMNWMRRWGSWTIFVLALIPNPLFDLAGMAAGSLRYPLWKYIVFGGAGRLIKHVGYAYAGHLGLRLLPVPG